MSTSHSFYDRSASFIRFSMIGGGIALALFLGTFILTSRANTPHPQSNLRIPVPPAPDLPSPTPVFGLVLPQEATPTASPVQQEEIIPETSEETTPSAETPVASETPAL